MLKLETDLNHKLLYIKRLVQFLFKEKKILFVIFFICILGSVGISSNLPPIYQTSSALSLEAPGWNSFNFIEMINKRGTLNDLKLKTVNDSNKQFKIREVVLIPRTGTTIIDIVAKSESAADAKELVDEATNDILGVLRTEQKKEIENKVAESSLQLSEAEDTLRKAENEMSNFYKEKKMNENDINYIIVRDSLEIAKENYINIQNQVNRYRFKLLYASHVDILNEATLPEKPMNRNKQSAIGIGSLLGILIFTGYLLFLKNL